MAKDVDFRGANFAGRRDYIPPKMGLRGIVAHLKNLRLGWEFGMTPGPSAFETVSVTGRVHVDGLLEEIWPNSQL